MFSARENIDYWYGDFAIPCGRRILRVISADFQREKLVMLLLQVMTIKTDRKANASVNSSCAHPPPGKCGAFAHPVSSGGWGISKFGTARGSGIFLPRGYPRGFDTLVVSDSKSKHGEFYRKGPAIRCRLDRPSWTGRTSGGFLDFIHFFIAYQGTTRAITIYSDIGNDQRESTYACFFDQGFE